MQALIGKDHSSRNAALLLMKVRMIAIDEVHEMDSECGDYSPETLSIRKLSSPDLVMDEDSFSSFTGEASQLTTPRPSTRCRAVSICSQDIELSPSLSPSSVLPARIVTMGALLNHDKSSLTSSDSDGDSVLLPQLPYKSSTKFVGEDVKGTVKAVLRKKFSWKNFPELENYLIKNRQEYLEYSSSLNYTAEQKLYNNTLTKGLIDLANEVGYIFEGFTFAAVRDRIRCYFKSYVQSLKKKKKRKKKRCVH